MNYKFDVVLSACFLILYDLSLRCEASALQDPKCQERMDIANSYSYKNMPIDRRDMEPRTRKELLEGEQSSYKISAKLIKQMLLFEDSDSDFEDKEVVGSFDTQDGTNHGDNDL